MEACTVVVGGGGCLLFDPGYVLRMELEKYFRSKIIDRWKTMYLEYTKYVYILGLLSVGIAGSIVYLGIVCESYS